MKTMQPHHPIRPGGARQPTLITIALGAGLAAGLSGPTRADLINDFEGELRLAWDVVAPRVDFGVVNGELNFVLSGEAYEYGFACDYRCYEIPETEPITFTIDLVDLGGAWFAGIGTHFAHTSQYSSWGGSYTFYRGGNEVFLEKLTPNSTWLNRVSVVPQTAPETLSLTMRRQGDSLELTGTVAQRDSGQVIQSVHFLDTPAVDPTYQGTDSGAPNLGPISVVQLIGLLGDQGDAVVVCDNWRCSEEPAPLTLTARRTAGETVAVEWTGDALLLQATSPTGGWAPSLAGVSASPNGYSAQVSPTGTSAFFRLVPGPHVQTDFSSGVWSVGTAVPGAWGTRLSFSSVGGKGRALGRNLGDNEFIMRRWMEGLWLGDSVASVDIVDWDLAMEEGTAFGMVLRANPGDWTWSVQEDGLPEKHYLGRLTFKRPGNPAESLLSLTGPGRELLQETSLPAVDPAKDYQLRFWAIGDRLTLELFDLENPAAPIATCVATDGRSPRGIDALYVAPTPVGTTLIDIDNYVVRGMHAAAQW